METKPDTTNKNCRSTRRAEYKRHHHAKKKSQINDWKRERGCQECGEREPLVLELHHLDPAEKEIMPSKAGSFERFLEEAQKCVVLCANCHRKVHAGILTLTGN